MTIDALLRDMRSREREGDVAGALALYDAAPATLRADPLALYARGTIFFDANRFAEAETAFRAAYEREPKNPDFCVNLAVTILREGNDPARAPSRAPSRAKEAIAILTPLEGATDARANDLRATIDHLVSVAHGRL